MIDANLESPSLLTAELDPVRMIPGPAGPNEVTEETATDLTGVLYGNGESVEALPLDDAPAEGSDHPISSGAVYNALADLNYKPIEITGMSISPAQAEMGSTVAALSVSWTLSKAPAAQELNGNGIAPTDRSATLTGVTSANLAVRDGGSPSHAPAVATRSASVSFLNRAYWGAAAEGTVDSTFLLALSNSALTSTRARAFTVNAGAGQYIWYAVPARLGACAFKVGGFDGGFTLAATISHTNASGYTESYRVYRSDNAALGSTTVVVS